MRPRVELSHTRAIRALLHYACANDSDLQRLTIVAIIRRRFICWVKICFPSLPEEFRVLFCSGIDPRSEESAPWNQGRETGAVLMTQRAGDWRIFSKIHCLTITIGANPEDPLLISTRSEEHTSELQSLRHLVCRLL